MRIDLNLSRPANRPIFAASSLTKRVTMYAKRCLDIPGDRGRNFDLLRRRKTSMSCDHFRLNDLCADR
jgi:hypothetical protein